MNEPYSLYAQNNSPTVHVFPPPSEVSLTARFWGMPEDITEFIRCMAQRHGVSLYYTSLETSGFFTKTKTGQFTYSGPRANVEAFGRAFQSIRVT